jgi:hypothetical protein
LTASTLVRRAGVEDIHPELERLNADDNREV